MTQPRTRRQLVQLGAALRKARVDAGLTQDQLGELAGVSRQLVSRVETGSPRGEIGRVVDIASALGLQLVTVPTSPRTTTSRDQQAIQDVFARIQQGAAQPSPQAPEPHE
ncbi:helix-turn-helix transcriptional regulator [Nocardia sp. NPDC060256]|uniref:helix-turn-helix transcriptional regulator n=1 Tax=unclassified Nocardia TaxID=2637762 RepID=UPI003669A4C1